MKERIDWKDYASFITKTIRNGILFTISDGLNTNTMTIGWGNIGYTWSKPTFIAFIRRSRFTADLLLKSSDFTINVPLDDSKKEILTYLGTKSGRDEDKIKVMNLTLVPSENITSPGIKEFPLTLECKVLYIDKIDISKLPKEIKDRYYPLEEDKRKILNNEPHYVIYGEIVDSYIIK